MNERRSEMNSEEINEENKKINSDRQIMMMTKTMIMMMSIVKMLKLLKSAHVKH